MELNENIPLLSHEEIRVLGCLIEKSKTTPDYYPLSLNSLTAACNQKSSRNPVVEYDEPTVLNALSRLKAQSLVATAVGGGTRTIKYKHNFVTVFPSTDAELAILCLLFLRGAQTAGELNTNSNRLHEFSSIESVLECLDNLSSPDKLFVKQVSKKSGQKEMRFTHCFSSQQINEEENEIIESKNKPSIQELEMRINDLEKELYELKVIVEKINTALF